MVCVGLSASLTQLQAQTELTSQSPTRLFGLSIAGTVMQAGSDDAPADFQENSLPSLQSFINQNLSEGQDLGSVDALALDPSQFRLETDSKVRVYSVSEGTGYHNTLGYNTEGTGVNEGTPLLIFPDASSLNSNTTFGDETLALRSDCNPFLQVASSIWEPCRPRNSWTFSSSPMPSMAARTSSRQMTLLIRTDSSISSPSLSKAQSLPGMESLPETGPHFVPRPLPLGSEEAKRIQGARVIKRLCRSKDQLLWLVAIDGSENRHAVHDPLYCLRGQGWRTTKQHEIPIAHGAGKSYSLVRDGESKAFIYWFSSGSTPFHSMTRYWAESSARRLTRRRSSSEPILHYIIPIGQHGSVQWHRILESATHLVNASKPQPKDEQSSPRRGQLEAICAEQAAPSSASMPHGE